MDKEALLQQLLKLEKIRESVHGILECFALYADLPKSFRNAIKAGKFGILGSFAFEYLEWYND